jgi:hypothetical protein
MEHRMLPAKFHAFAIHRALSLPFANSRSSRATIGEDREKREIAVSHS